MDALRTRVLELLAAQTSPISDNDIEALLPDDGGLRVSLRGIRRILSRLENEGRVASTHRGEWRIKSDGTEELDGRDAALSGGTAASNSSGDIRSHENLCESKTLPHDRAWNWPQPGLPILPSRFRTAIAEYTVLKMGETRITASELDASIWQKPPVTEAIETLRSATMNLVREQILSNSELQELPIISETAFVSDPSSLPWSTRVRNVLTQNDLLSNPVKLKNTTLSEFMRFRNFGLTSLLEFSCTYEHYSSTIKKDLSEYQNIDHLTPHDNAETLVSPLSYFYRANLPTIYQDILDRLIGWAGFYHGVQTLEDLLRIDLLELAEEVGAEEDIKELDLEPIINNECSKFLIGDAFVSAIDNLDSRKRIIALQRTFSHHPRTLDDLRKDLDNISRERVRQLEVDLEQEIARQLDNRISTIKEYITHTLGLSIPAATLIHTICLFIEDARDDMRSYAIAMLLKASGYEITDEGYAVKEEFMEWINELHELAPKYANSFGVLDEPALREAIDPPSDALWESMIATSEVSRILSHAVLKDRNRTRVYLALQELGVPSTQQAVAELARVPESSVANILSYNDCFVRVTKDEWGFRDWTDNPYEGLVPEIIQRIEEAGGLVPVDVLLEELPDKCGVAASSVKTYLSTPKFKVENGMASISSDITVTRRPLKDLDDIMWDDEGTPVLIIVVHQTHLQGHSIKIKPEVSFALGVEPDQSDTIAIRSPEDCEDISVIWRAHDPMGPEIGRLRPVLEKLGATPGSKVAITLRPEGLDVTLTGSGVRTKDARGRINSTPEGDNEPHGSAKHLEIIKKLKARRKLSH